MKNSLLSVLEIIKLAEKLKYELRHSWLSNGRQESVAEHTWRMSLMAVLIEPHLSQKVDTARLLKMIIIHDLVEADAGDIPAFDTMNDEERKQQKLINEVKSIERIRSILGDELGEELYQLWFEFENKDTYEAKVANALDKLEAQIQHNEADLATWIEIEYEMSFLLDRHVDFDPTMKALKELIESEADSKLTFGGINTDLLKEKL
ncbi:putative hydrolase of HD superfamily [Alkalihalobacillus xiaoxiensis]|uniref:Hydrolase of HD superfamily n=1 Tax=Shouchella xiaoxiensis TaxID=766895 RepID=A0ABS2SSH8_9BACI|nr:HD domain-containing protein [Shouchella xiaoxiensis]MBM7837237.1 putative hydrolase of HD superfamily [Shouchella xiaoxiensis]